MIVLLGLGTVVVVAVLAGLVVFLLFVLAVVGGQDALARPDRIPSEEAAADIPVELLAVYRQAAAETCDMRWSVLAAVGKVETDHGRSALPGVSSAANGAGAMGPMQFLAGTWAAYGVDGDNDGTVDVYDRVDAVRGAANYLCATGAGDPGRERDAIWSYNHAGWYVDLVLEQAARYEAAMVAGVGDVRLLVDHPNLSLSPAPRQDLLDGVVDQRVVDFLAWAVQSHQVAVSVLKSGHSQFVAGTSRTSNHWYGRGLDIYAVDGEVVSFDSPAARALAIEAMGLVPPGRPSEIGLPWADLTGDPGVFSDSSHQDHLHFGWSGNAPEFHQVKDPDQ